VRFVVISYGVGGCLEGDMDQQEILVMSLVGAEGRERGRIHIDGCGCWVCVQLWKPV